jgi:hypothetical protein
VITFLAGFALGAIAGAFGISLYVGIQLQKVLARPSIR